MRLKGKVKKPNSFVLYPYLDNGGAARIFFDSIVLAMRKKKPEGKPSGFGNSNRACDD